MRWLLLTPFAFAVHADDGHDKARAVFEKGNKVCAALEPIYKTGRVKIEEAPGVFFWCSFNRPTLPVERAPDCIDEINGKKSKSWPARRENGGWTCYADDARQ
jgi:hypothetical protein